MKTFLVSAAILFLLDLSSTAWAKESSAVKALVNQNGCMACHTVDQKLVGPSFKQVADRYRGKKGSLDMLAKKIIAGGNGHWNDLTGGMVMPSHPDLSSKEAKEIAAWVLSIK